MQAVELLLRYREASTVWEEHFTYYTPIKNIPIITRPIHEIFRSIAKSNKEGTCHPAKVSRRKSAYNEGGRIFVSFMRRHLAREYVKAVIGKR